MSKDASNDEQKSRQERWGGVISQLESNLFNDNWEDENHNLSSEAKGDELMSHTSFLASRSDERLSFDSFSLLSAPGLRNQSSMNPLERINSHSIQSSPTNVTPLTTMTLYDWIQSQKQTISHSGMNLYFEKSVNLLKSLVLDITRKCYPLDGSEIALSVHPDDINSKNIRVIHSNHDGDSAHFILRSHEEGVVLNFSIKNYAVMNELGKIAYELLMQGKSSAELNVNTKDAVENISHALNINDNITIKSSNVSVEKDINDFPRKNARRISGNRRGGVTASMLEDGVPYPLCRFVTDLLDGNGSNEMLFRCDNSFQSFSEVLSDLQQMLDMPEFFIHSHTTDRSSLTFGKKLYGREKEIRILTSIADRVVTKRSNDSIFDALASFMPKSKQQIVIITGKSGSGKSRLVVETSSLLQNQGWLFLRGKFDRVVHAEPLSTIANVFENCLEFCFNKSKLSKNEKGINSNFEDSLQRIRENIQKKIESDGLSILSRHVPILRKFLDGQSNTESTFPYEKEISKEQMHHLFGQLLQVISMSEQPILFFIDDLQWADAASLELFLALTKMMNHESIAYTSEGKSNVLFIGAYRDNEVDESHLLTKTLSHFESDNTVEVTVIPVSDFDHETLTTMLSESLYLPLRKTKLLSEIILQKTDGVIIHIIEFIQRLIMDKVLRYCFVSGWEWDIDVIDMYPISKSVAELFTAKLQRLPSTVLLGVQILSCFGNKIDRRIINFIQDFDGDNSVDITAALLSAVSEGLVEMLESGQLFVFAHDILQQSTFESILVDDRIELLRKLASTLIRNASAANDLESVIFLSVDLINCIGTDFVTNVNERALYASLNERAAKRALAVPDFSSAVKYSEAGISFLNEDHWNKQYDLSLSLYENSIAAHYSNADASQSLLQKRIDAVFSHARSFSDKFNSNFIWIKLLSTTSLQQAINESHRILELLDEPINPSTIGITDVRNEFLRVRNNFPEEKELFSSATPIHDIDKLRAMKIMSSLMIFYHAQKSVVGAFIACRMIELSMKYGLCEYSSMAAAAFATGLVNTLDDVNEGYFWGRMALALMSKSSNANVLVPVINAAVYGVVLVWKEPIQSTLEYLLYGCQLAFETGNLQFAIANAKGYVSRSFFSGKELKLLQREVESLAYKCGQHNQHSFIQMYLSPIYNVMRHLLGLEPQALAPVNNVLSVDDILNFGIQEKDLHIVHNQLSCAIFQLFLFKQIENATSMIDLYYDLFDGKIQHVTYAPTNILLDGLISYHHIRKTNEEIWRSRAQTAFNKLKMWWTNHSKWNFENKYLLLCAEYHRTESKIMKAIQCYEASIKCAHEHSFWHEEALACELAAEFFTEQREYKKARAMLEQSSRAYMKWGAIKKAKMLPIDHS